MVNAMATKRGIKIRKDYFKGALFISRTYSHFKCDILVHLCDSYATESATRAKIRDLGHSFKSHLRILNIVIKAVENNIINLNCKMCNKDLKRANVHYSRYNR